MRDADAVAVRTYRIRILALGVFVLVVAAAIGAPWYLGRIESDLERRVHEELVTRGLHQEGEVSASFQGQDGRVRCRTPMADPEAAIDAVIDLRGVRTVTLDRSCRVNAAPSIGTTVPDTSADPVETTTTEASEDPEDPDPPMIDPPAFDSLADLVASDPQFSILAALIDDAGLGALFEPGRALTVFAPHDEAFAALPPDALAELRGDPELAAHLIRHHLVDGIWLADALRSGTVETLSGNSIELTATGRVIGEPPRYLGDLRVGDAIVTTIDLTAVDGVAHAIDTVQFPEDLHLEAFDPVPVVTVRMVDGTITLSGTVPDELTQILLVRAALAVVPETRLVGELETDATVELGTAETTAMARLLRESFLALGEGTLSVIDSELELSGTYVDDASRQRLVEIAADLDAAVTVNLDPRPEINEEQLTETQSVVDEILAASPIVFPAASATPTPESIAVIDHLAGLLRRWTGMSVTVAGYTDTSGSAAVNQELSEQRATAVVAALIERGVPSAQLDAVGFGQSVPIIVDGVEDPIASRRVELQITKDLASGANR